VSVLVVVIVVTGARVRVFVFRFVEDWIADYVFFARPVAEIEEAAAFAAERKIGVCFGVGRFVADGTAVFHGFYSKANMDGFQWEFDAARGIEPKEPAGRRRYGSAAVPFGAARLGSRVLRLRERRTTRMATFCCPKFKIAGRRPAVQRPVSPTGRLGLEMDLATTWVLRFLR